MPLLENCLSRRSALKRATYHVIDFANIMHDLHDWGKFVNKVLSIPETDVVVVVGKPIRVDNVLYDAGDLYKTAAAPRLGRSIFVYVITYAASLSSNVDDILFWFVIYGVFLSKNRVHIHTRDAQPLDKDSTYLSDPAYLVHEATPRGLVHRPQTQRTCAKIIKMVMHTTPPYKLERAVPPLVRTIARDPTVSYARLKRTRRIPRPLYFFAYIKYIQSVVGISKL